MGTEMKFRAWDGEKIVMLRYNHQTKTRLRTKFYGKAKAYMDKIADLVFKDNK